MKNEIYHSAEGSTWTKKNHKYIRKEGNRYIYPKDLTAESRPDKPEWYNSGTYKDNHGRKHEYLSATYVNKGDRDPKTRYTEKIEYDRDYTHPSTRTSTSKARSEQQQFRRADEINRNRRDAANGKAIKPIIGTWRGSDGQVLGTVRSERNHNMATADDYRKYSQLRGGAANRSKAMNKQESANYKQMSRNHADHQKELRELREMEMEERREKSRKSGNQAIENAKEANQRAKTANGRYSKDYVDEVRNNSKGEFEYKPISGKSLHTEPKSNKSDYEKELEANSRKNDRSIDTKPITVKPIETKPIQVKKSTNGQKGVFTLGEDGQTKFVPESENKPKKKTNKALEKGKKALDAIKSKLSKKKKG